MEKALVEAGIAKGEYQAIKIRLRELGYHALLVKGPHTEIKFRCKERHEWHATPMQAINDGCPQCELIRHIKEDPPPVISFAEFEKAVSKQQKFLKAVLKKTKQRLVHSKSRAPSGRYGV